MKDLLFPGTPIIAAAFLAFVLFSLWRRHRLEIRSSLLEVLAYGVARGVPLPPLVEQLATQQPRRRRGRLRRVAKALREGASLSEALSQNMSNLFAPTTLAAIEASAGRQELALVLEMLSRDVHQVQGAQHRMTMLLFYPCLLAGLLIWAANGWSVRESAILNNLDIEAAPLQWLSNIAPWMFLPLAVLFFLRISDLWVWRSDLLLGDRLLRTMAVLTRAGVPLPQALRRAGSTLTSWNGRRRVQRVADLLEEGSDVNAALSHLPLPAFARQRLRFGSRPKFLRNLTMLAQECNGRYESQNERLLARLQPLLLVMVGLFLAGLMHRMFHLQGVLLEKSTLPW